MNTIYTGGKRISGGLKKVILLASLIVFALTITACGKKEDGTSSAAAAETGTEKKQHKEIVATIFPEYDWVREILGENPGEFELTLLLDSGVDLHSFQPTAEDIMRISRCDMFIYVGGESDKWVADALKEATNKDMVVINLMEEMGNAAVEEEAVEGMQGEEEEEEEGEEEGPEYDEHVWLSLRSAVHFTDVIEKKLETIDPEHKSVYEANAKAYMDKLSKMDEDFTKVVDSAARKTVLFGDRFPFRYFTENYGLKYYAAFLGCSAETEASFETVTFLAGKVDELSLPVIFVIEGGEKRLADTILKNTKDKTAEIVSLDSMQGTTKKDIDAGVTYISIMEKNLAAIEKGLK